MLSQAGEGWTTLPTIYDDPAYSGGTMDRPALQALLDDVRSGLIDIVVVYKVDRLTRSLADFAKIVEVFDQHGVSFVSVTQAFNTTSSMGRLTLNVLLSFAQFEREVTGERIRDKIAASKAKGMWMGGVPPLGYTPKDRTLVIVPAEAEQVRSLFRRYLELGSVHELEAELRAQGLRSKAWTTQAGRRVGGRVFSRGALYHLLRNPVYLGCITHKHRTYPGAHAAIVDQDLFDQVQTRLTQNRIRHGQRPLKGAACLLKGKLFNDAGELMSPTIAYGKAGKAFRYYVAGSVQCGRRSPARIRRVSATVADVWLAEQLSRLLEEPAEGLERVRRVDLEADRVVATLDLSDRDLDDLLPRLRARLIADERLVRTAEAGVVQVSLPGRLRFRGGRTSMERTGSSAPKVDAGLIRALRKGHALLKLSDASPLLSLRRQKRGKAIADPYEQALSRLAFLAPDIQAAIHSGAQPAGLTLTRLIKTPIPLSWRAQRRLLGFADAQHAVTD